MVSLLNPELAYWGSLAHPGLLWGSSVYLLSSGIIGSLPDIYTGARDLHSASTSPTEPFHSLPFFLDKRAIN